MDPNILTANLFKLELKRGVFSSHSLPMTTNSKTSESMENTVKILKIGTP